MKLTLSTSNRLLLCFQGPHHHYTTLTLLAIHKPRFPILLSIHCCIQYTRTGCRKFWRKHTPTTGVVNFPNEVSKHTINVPLLLSSALQKDWRTACKRFYFPGVRCPGYKCCPLRTSREINFQARHSHKTRHHSSYCCRGWKGHWQFWERFCVWWMLPVYNIILWILLEFQNFYILNWWQYADKLLR